MEEGIDFVEIDLEERVEENLTEEDMVKRRRINAIVTEYLIMKAIYEVIEEKKYLEAEEENKRQIYSGRRVSFSRPDEEPSGWWDGGIKILEGD